ncbi:peptidylprolyl isomerase [Pontibacter harenae]|uniref:peptidylprolyl isomerase n=1 Tax=Pontibacter harenae TaxID=2894083 RepID=UPI001E5AC147|nr:peptidylprolyl isomerase [Pontibacter harenae]MCC9165939.1 peptidylprolyl isomerase [Pontibacter harenae]
MRSKHLLVAAVTLALAGCTASKKSNTQEPVLATIGNKPLYASEFRYVYEKNNSGNEDAYTKKSLEEYLQLYTNYKLKVMEAERQGLDTVVSFKRELEGYKEQLAQPYLTETSVTDKLVREAYERLQKEVNASHILINLPPDAAPEDTLAAYNRVLALRERVVAGEDFSKLAREFSEDPSAADNGGSLGYFTSMQMVYPFEDAAYKTDPGQISMPVRTRFGYHLIKVNDVRNALGEVKVAHIMVRANPGIPKADSIAAKQRVDAIYKRVQRNEDWNKLASEFSEDASTAPNGGELPWFGTGRMIPSFEEAAFTLQNTNEVAKPVYTPYGWHIIKLLDKRGLPSYDSMEQNLRNKIAKDSRSELNKTAFLKRIKVENNFAENSATKEAALSKATDDLLQGNWSYDANDKSLAASLFTIQGKPYSVADFYAFAKTAQRPRATGTAQHAMTLLYNDFVNKSLLEYEKENLENKHEDYRMLVKEYHDGILFFQLMGDKVWTKSAEDSVGLQAYFDKNKEKYKWGERVEATVISASDKQVLQQVQEQLANGRYLVNSGKPTDILFKANSSALTKEATAKLDELAARLKSNPELSVDVNGHADAREAAGKIDFSAQRAQAVMTYLVAQKVPISQFRTNVLQNSKQAGPDNSETGRGRNRRVSFTLYSSNLKTLANNLNTDNPLAVQVSQKKFQKGENKTIDAVAWEKGTYTITQNGREYLIVIHDVLAPAYKQLSEVRGAVISDYQNYLEQEWVEELRNKYSVKINEEEVEKLIRN